MRRQAVVAVLLLAGGVAACTDITIQRAPDRITTPIANPSWSGDIAPVLRQTCGSASACHGGPTGQRGMVLEGSDSAMYAHIVNVRSQVDTLLMRVRPSQPDSSWLLLVLSDTAAVRKNYYRMPLTELPLPNAVRITIRNWIANGAPGN